jgi:hypothetical protein
MNINSKEREDITNSTSTRRRTWSQRTSGSLCSKLEVFIWRHVVYVQKSSTLFRGILICVGGISNIFGKKRNIIVTFQSGQLTEQPKTLDDLGCFDMKMFCNCSIRIEIIHYVTLNMCQYVIFLLLSIILSLIRSIHVYIYWWFCK